MSDTTKRAKRVRPHTGTLADSVGERPALELKVIGQRPNDAPYLVVREIWTGDALAFIENANALRGLAHAILRSLGDPTP